MSAGPVGAMYSFAAKHDTMILTRSSFLKPFTLLLLFGILSNKSRAQSIPPLAGNQLVLPDGSFTIPFHWQGDSINGKWEPHTALLLPVKLKNCPRLFYMQFDLGHPYSVLYTEKLAAIRLQYPKALPENEAGNKLANFSFQTGRMQVLAKEITLQQFDSAAAINWTDKKAAVIIGTIGADLIDDKAVMIDYPKQQLTIASSVPKKLLSQLSMTDMVYERRNLLFPATIKDKSVLLYFDTGSSMYELLVDKKTCEDLAAPGSAFVQSKSRSWDKYLTANTIASNAGITINGITIPLHHVTYIEGVSTVKAEQMRKMGIGGMTGNKLFLNYKLVLDTKHKKFGLIRSQ